MTCQWPRINLRGLSICVRTVSGLNTARIHELSAARGTAIEGASLLFVYALGLGIPFLLVAIFTGTFLRRLKSVGRFGRQLQVGSGVVLLFVGLAMAIGYLGVAGTWMLTNLTWLQSLIL